MNKEKFEAKTRQQEFITRNTPQKNVCRFSGFYDKIALRVSVS